MAKQRRPDRELYEVRDPRRLAGLIVEEVNRRFGGNASAAHRDTQARARRKPGQPSLGGPQFHRLIHGDLKRIRRATVRWLVCLLPDRRHYDLQETLLSPASQTFLGDYQGWLSRRMPVYVSLNGPVAAWQFRHSRGREETGEFWDEVGRTLCSDWVRKYRSELRPLEQMLKDRPVPPHRERLLWRRMVDPLLAHSFGGIERGWDELTDQEKRAFVKASVRRECIMLKRADDIERAQEAASSSTNTAPPPIGLSQTVRRVRRTGWFDVGSPDDEKRAAD